ncbi:hypothetical protein SAMD00023353_5300790 [Rosellinia necatrix]|uniref:Uncharacterized protein n=1 Tax=Rosellinia necatrix TaxID=77044 RepID=A0A1W2TRN8_ROSNE|nr:hypothetical protein SAMD00023353_5300790 [Rosellinia necatrix]
MFKLSMLFFFKRLGTSVDNFDYLWWPIFFLSLAAFLISIGDVDYQCLFGDLNTNTVYCNSRQATKFLRVTLDVNAAFDVLADFSREQLRCFLGKASTFEPALTAVAG